MKSISVITIMAALLFVITESKAQTVIPLYKKVPNSKKSDVEEKSDSTSKRGKVSNVVNPTITAFFPEKSKANGTAVIICPGGGYSYLVVNDEGSNVAKEFAARGVAAFVLKYRLPNDVIMVNREIGPLQDAQQATKIVRENAKEWNIDPAKVGIMGFSAGGHLASTAATHYQKAVIDNPLKTNLRPDFALLIYPVISFQDSILHKGSKKALIGENAGTEKVIEYSNEMQVTADTPPTFLVHASNDKVVPVANSINYYTALQKHGVNAEIHVYQSGGHGFGLNNPTTTDKWLEHCFNWMIVNHLL
ncbi:prolyl oligopeptidase family serine peptidase [Pedobacter sp. HMF7647]|uniref:Prolyl oligopeptidase family serine peptidase n=1 Tax=Hufsiella arboris TaxID=2695275 RepID=A0A7K1YD22_9SPHI|nr:alpha/beta hydrolase [Hufsiella arboris]MXV52486.1 prolyl oligopeptidase family serine peptidase [Hufsiella arboris]